MGPLPLIAAGYLLGLALSWSPPPLLLAALSIAFALWASLLARRRALAGAALLVAAAACAGGARRGALEVPSWPSIPAADASRVRGRVLEGCARDADRDRCVVDLGDAGAATLRVPAGRCAATPGDVIEVVATVRPVIPMRNAPLPAPETPALLRNVRWRVEGASCAVVGREASALDRLRGAALRVRAWMSRSLDRALAPVDASRARALLFGDGAGLDAAEREAFSESGMAHLLAVSGAHVSLLLTLVGALARAALARVPWAATRGLAPRLASVIPLPAVGFFVMVTGEAPSSLRALWSAAICAAASFAGRKARTESVVALVALAMAARAPALVLDVGWVLSVTAAWALARAPRDRAPRGAPKVRPTALGHLRDELLGALATSARVGLVVVPALAWNFGRSPLTAIVMNAVAAPVGEALLLPAVLVVVALGAIAPAGVATLAGAGVGALLGSLFALPSVALRLPLASIALPMPTPAQWVAATAFALVASGHRARVAWRVAAAGVAVVAALEAAHRHAIDHRGALRVTALDVGQGDALVVELPDGAAMLVDAGGAITGGPDPGARVVVPWLALHRRAELAAVVLSHPHPDHAGGLAAVLRSARADALWDTGQGASLGYAGVYGEALRAAREGRVPVAGPDRLCGPPRRFHGAWVEVLAPCPGVRDGVAPNDASFVIRIRYGRATLLLPGDLEREGEAALLPALGRVDVLKVGHHGSRTSSTDAFLDAVRPRVALVSCGHPSPFGHPHPSVLARFVSRGIDLRRTDLSGAVTATLFADGRVE